MSYNPSAESVQLQKSSAYYAFAKTANTLSYGVLLLLTWRFVTGHLDWQLSTGCVLISACWLVLTRIKIDHLLQTYFDVLSRIELTLPMVAGVILSGMAIFVRAAHPYFHVVALAEMAFWCWIYLLYKRNQQRFSKQGYGPVPVNTYMKPPASMLQPGDLILTSGQIAKDLHEIVGHAEVVLRRSDGQMVLFSSYMDKGTTVHPLDELTGPSYKGYYVGLHLRNPWSDAEQAKAMEIADQMVATNKRWAAEENVRVEKRINWLPLPLKEKQALKRFFHASGYDWFGTFMGRVVDDRWTCIGAAVELYHRMGVRTNPYGTGLLGWGTSILDPIMPVRFLADPAFELITKDTDLPALITQSNSVQR